MKRGTLFLTGATGMLGRNIIEHAEIFNWTLLAPTSNELDLTNSNAVEEYLNSTKPDLIIHAAGHVGGIQSNIAHPVAFLERNISMGRNVIMSAYKTGVKNLINMASTCIYPRSAENPLKESFVLSGELEPTNEGYALAKIMALRLCQYIRREAPTYQYKTLIPCNLYGKFDKFEPERSHLVPAIIHKVHTAKINASSTVEIWGTGEARREFMYAADAADAILQATGSIETLPDIMNIGTGIDYSVKEYYEIAAEVIGWNGSFVTNKTKPVGMKRKLSDITRQKQWGWMAKTALRDGIQKTYHFYLENFVK